jgi:transposase InsO family protein
LKESWEDNGKVYGCRKLHDDLSDQGETCCPNHVARPTRMAGIKARIGYKRRIGTYGGKPLIAVDNTLDRQFDTTSADTAWVTDITYIKTTNALPIWQSCLICIPVASWVGQFKAVKPQTSFCKPCTWLCGAGSRRTKF